MPMTVNLGGVGGALSVTRYQAPVINWSNANITLDGDSLTDFGYNEVEYGIFSWPSALDSLLPSAVTINNVARADSTFYNEGNSYTWLSDPTRMAAFNATRNGAKYNICGFFAGTNDVAGAAQTGAATASRAATRIAAARTAGWDFVFMMNCCWRIDLSSGAAATRRADLNAALSGVGADLVIDVSSAIGTEPTHPANFWSDDIHFSQHAHTNVIAPLVRTALYGALGSP